MMRWLVGIITFLIVPVFSVYYDETTHSYNDLLVSISPDLPGRKMFISTSGMFYYCFLESDSAEILENVKAWITEVSCVVGSTIVMIYNLIKELSISSYSVCLHSNPPPINI